MRKVCFLLIIVSASILFNCAEFIPGVTYESVNYYSKNDASRHGTLIVECSSLTSFFDLFVLAEVVGNSPAGYEMSSAQFGIDYHDVIIYVGNNRYEPSGGKLERILLPDLYEIRVIRKLTKDEIYSEQAFVYAGEKTIVRY